MGNGVFGNRSLRWIRLSELVFLLSIVEKAAKHPDVGFEHCDYTPEKFLRQLDKFTKIRDEHLEAMLWSANLLDEAGGWQHPKGISFKQFVKDLLPDASFDFEYNLIKRKKKRKPA